MNIFESIIAAAGLLVTWGSIWFKLGKLTSEVKGHNAMLKDIKEDVDNLCGKGGN